MLKYWINNTNTKLLHSFFLRWNMSTVHWENRSEGWVTRVDRYSGWSTLSEPAIVADAPHTVQLELCHQSCCLEDVSVRTLNYWNLTSLIEFKLNNNNRSSPMMHMLRREVLKLGALFTFAISPCQVHQSGFQEVIAVHDQLTYLIQLEDGQNMRRHADHIRSRGVSTTSIATPDDWVHIPVPTAPCFDSETETCWGKSPMIHQCTSSSPLSMFEQPFLQGHSRRDDKGQSSHAECHWPSWTLGIHC